MAPRRRVATFCHVQSTEDDVESAPDSGEDTSSWDEVDEEPAAATLRDAPPPPPPVACATPEAPSKRMRPTWPAWPAGHLGSSEESAHRDAAAVQQEDEITEEPDGRSPSPRHGSDVESDVAVDAPPGNSDDIHAFDSEDECPVAVVGSVQTPRASSRWIAQLNRGPAGAVPPVGAEQPGGTTDRTQRIRPVRYGGTRRACRSGARSGGPLMGVPVRRASDGLAERLVRQAAAERSATALWQHRRARKAPDMVIRVVALRTEASLVVARCIRLQPFDAASPTMLDVILQANHAKREKVAEGRVLEIARPWQEIWLPSATVAALLCVHRCNAAVSGSEDVAAAAVPTAQLLPLVSPIRTPTARALCHAGAADDGACERRGRDGGDPGTAGRHPSLAVRLFG